MIVPAGLWVAFQHPEIAITIVSIFLALFIWLSPKVFRLLHVSWMALRSVVGKLLGHRVPAGEVAIPDVPVARQLRDLPFQPLPPKYARRIEKHAIAGVQCVATHRVRGLKNCIGFLCVTSEGLVFVAQRLFRLRTYRVPWSNLQNVSLKRGVFFDSLSLVLLDQEIGFDLFKAKVAAPEHVLTNLNVASRNQP
jgi:hypothetical protein